MGNLHGRVLVIDDDPFMLKVINDLLEKAGFFVVARTSAIGATQVIVRERIDAAVIDWNLPVVNGDDVVRLFRTWDELKDLPVLMISGAPRETIARIQSELPGVTVLPKDELRGQLVMALGSVVGSNKTVRGMAPIKISPSGEMDTMPMRRSQPEDLVPSLLAQLAETMPIADFVWGDAARGQREMVEPLVERLDRLTGQARLLALEEAAALLQALTDTLRLLRDERPVSSEVSRAVERGIAALSALPDTGDGLFAIPPEPLISALERAQDELAARAPS